MNKSAIIISSVTVVLLIFFFVAGRSTIGNLIRGRVHFPDQNIGRILTMKDGLNFVVFRHLKVTGQSNTHKEPAVFLVRFKFRNLGSAANKRLSIIPAPFLMGMKGFREKIWTINEKTNDFLGIYQWSSKEEAGHYPDSFIFRLMNKRAAPGTVSYEIIPKTDMVEYLTTNHMN